MKKNLSLFLLLCVVSTFFVGCTKNGADASDNNNSTVQQKTENTSATAPDTNENNTAKTSDNGIDVDLTLLGGSMVYAEVYNIMSRPKDYVGKTIKMNGPYNASFYEKTGSYYHYVIIEDAAACCQQGLEFVWNGTHAYPKDYPKDKTKIEVAGEFKSYEELGQTYYYLSVDDISIL